VRVRIGGDDRWIAVEDVAKYRDALGVQPPRGVPDVFLEETSGALDTLLVRWARTHAPFTARDPAERWGLPPGVVQDALRRIEEAGNVLRGEFRPGGTEREWCDPDVLRSLRRRSLARLRREVERSRAALASFCLPGRAWAVSRAAPSRLYEGVSRLGGILAVVDLGARRAGGAGARLPAAAARRLLREWRMVWVARGSVGADDGRVALLRRDRFEFAGADFAEDHSHPSTQDYEHLAARGAVSATSSPRSAGRAMPSCSTRCGTWPGQAKSPTTPSRRCASASCAKRAYGGRCTWRGPDHPRRPGDGRWCP
jgi:ATP-dependent Lhr-like helicase